MDRHPNRRPRLPPVCITPHFYPTHPIPPSLAHWLTVCSRRFSEAHSFTKPNDRRALELMNASATAILRALPDIILGFGISDEYSFILRRSAELFERREAKLVSTVVSTFTAYYVHLWPTYFPDSPLDATHLPTFDGRAVVYASNAELRDYVSWRQVDAHINNLYNTTFWALILKGGLDAREAETELQGTLAKDKNEILWGRFGINYNNEDEMFKKGSIVVREVSRRHHPSCWEA